MISRGATNLVPIKGRAEPSLLDWTAVEEEIRKQAAQSREEAFLLFALRHLFDFGGTSTRYWLTDGGNDRGIDAVVIDDFNKRIHFINAKCVRAFDKCSRNFPSAEVDKSITFLDELIHKSPALANCNDELTQAVKEVWDCLESAPYSLHLHLCSNQSRLVDNERERLKVVLSSKRITLEEHHLQAFADETPRILRADTRRLEFSGEKIERSLAKGRTITGFVSCAELARFLSDSIGSLDSSLFHGNIRSFLGTRTSINREIARTLFSRDRALFECLNNGLKLVCERMLTAGGVHPVHLTNPQVVNGLQTAHVLHAFCEGERQKGAEAFVLVHITETSDSNLANRIALATNSQQRIGTRDLRANDPLQLKLERELGKRGYRYLRKQGETSRVPASQTIDALKLGQILLAYCRDLPEKAKTSNAIFGEQYEEIFDQRMLSADMVISLHSLHRQIEDRKQLAKVAQRKISRDQYDEEWIIEGIYHVLFAVKVLCQGNGCNHLIFDEAKRFIDDAIEVIGECFERENTSAYRFFRLVGTRQVIEAALNQRLRMDAAKPRPTDNGQGDLFAPKGAN